MAKVSVALIRQLKKKQAAVLLSKCTLTVLRDRDNDPKEFPMAGVHFIIDLRPDIFC
jgi:hypothetical protein